jgi:catechol 2,3-dioxygenase-like lactoylglutathione lyase family enzyme
MLSKVAFTMYPVTDMPRARAFYEETLGLNRAGAEDDEEIGVTVRGPDGDNVIVNGRIKHSSLVRVRSSFVHEIMRSANDR